MRLFIVLMLAACTHYPPQAELTDSGYRHLRYPIRVAAEQGELLPGWRVRNWSRPSSGWEQRLEGTHLMKLQVDVNDDGRIDRRINVPRYHVQLEHPPSGGVIWLRSFPVSRRYLGRSMGAMLREYAADLSGGTYTLDGLTGAAVVREQRVTSTIVSENSGHVSGQPAHAATIDIADVDRLRMDPAHRTARARVVMVDMGTSEEFASRLTTASFPLVITIGYVNQPQYFDAQLPDFEAFVRRVQVRGAGETVDIHATAGSDTPVAPPPAQLAEPRTETSAPTDSEPVSSEVATPDDSIAEPD